MWCGAVWCGVCVACFVMARTKAGAKRSASQMSDNKVPIAMLMRRRVPPSHPANAFYSDSEKEASVDDASVDDASVDDAPVDDAPVDDAPVDLHFDDKLFVEVEGLDRALVPLVDTPLVYSQHLQQSRDGDYETPWLDLQVPFGVEALHEGLGRYSGNWLEGCESQEEYSQRLMEHAKKVFGFIMKLEPIRYFQELPPGGRCVGRLVMEMP